METILKTKLFVPQQVGELVQRQRLVNSLTEGIRRKLTLISAPAGFGKTTLVSEWIGQSNIPVCWVSLDENDSDPGRFLTYLIAALHSIGIDADSEQIKLLQSPEAGKFETVLISIINQIAEAQVRFAVVLDDYHRIHNEEVHKMLGYLVERLPPGVHLIIATRADPPLPVARLRARGQLTEIRAADLRFSIDEGDRFLNQINQLGLQPDDVQQLVTRADGWAAGLQLASIALRGRQDVVEYIERFSGTHDFIVDYLTMEVLDQQQPHIQEFLLKTAILNRLTAPLCELLTRQADCQQILRDLRANNIFLKALDDENQWFIYHGLFKDLLTQQLIERYPDDIPSLYQNASVWCEEHGLLDDAIEYALQGRREERAADLVAAQAQRTLRQSEIAIFIHWIEKLPQAIVYSRPNLCIYYAWALLISGRSPEIAADYLSQATADDDEIRGRVNAVRSIHAAFLRQIPESITYARQALEQLPPADYFFRQITGWNLSAALFLAGDGKGGEEVLADVARVSLSSDNRMVAVVTLCRLGRIRLQQGDLHRARAYYEQALDTAVENRSKPIPAACEAMFGLGKIYWEWYQFGTAQRMLSDGLALCKRWREVASIEGRITLAHLQLSQGDADSALQTIASTIQIASANLHRETGKRFVSLQEASLQLRLDNLAFARAWADESGAARHLQMQKRQDVDSPSAEVIRGFELLVFARILIVEKRYEDALALLTSVQSTLEKFGDRAKIIESLILLGIVQDRLHNRAKAVQIVRRALALAAPDKFLRVFVEENDVVVRLAKQVQTSGNVADFVNEIVDAAREAPDGGGQLTGTPPLIESLSDRELEILKLLVSDLSVPEIAANIHISVSTLRTHVRNIYRKMDTHNRFETVAKATELNII